MDDLLPWLSLKSVPGIGRFLFKRLYDQFNGPQQVFSASHTQLCQVDGMTDRLARAVLNHKIPDAVKNELKLVRQNGIGVITLADADYPRLLREIPDPPPILYVRGVLRPGDGAVAIVGSRRATAYGISTAKRLSADLAAMGLTVVSGMALGIDTAAHLGALSVDGRTVAVLGSGMLQVYPRQNRRLAGRIAEGGAVITEFAMDAEPDAHNFPLRNRIISGMCLGVVVVEAAPKSGSLITARLALDQNREVFAVPGNITSFKSMGTHRLIKSGAKLVENVDDILEEISAGLHPPESENSARLPEKAVSIDLTPDENRVMQLLDPYPVHIDQLLERCTLSAGALSSILLQLELKGLVAQTPGKHFNLITDRT